VVTEGNWREKAEGFCVRQFSQQTPPTESNTGAEAHQTVVAAPRFVVFPEAIRVSGSNEIGFHLADTSQFHNTARFELPRGVQRASGCL
jgi:hypothetical protein